MGNCYLNKNVKFKCQFGNAVWFSAQNGDMKVKVKGAEVLKDDCKLNLIGGPRPGQCNLFIDPSTNAPAQCIAVNLSGTWNNDSKLKVNGKNVLIENCSVSCPRNGTIKPFRPTLLSIDVDDQPKLKNINIISENNRKRPSDVNMSEILTESSNKRLRDTTDDNEIDDNRSSEVKEDTATQYALCDHKNCDKSKDCKYLQVTSLPKETNESKNAAELKINMGKDAFDLYAGECGNIATLLYGNYMYSIAHHHIIPVNQCFKQFPEIVKLANYYEYSINKAENGISLPTMNLGYDKQPFDLRKKIAFNAMDRLGKQWHKGGHSYSCKISANLDSMLHRPFKHYKNAVDEELTLLRNKLYNDMGCRAQNYEKQAEEFTKMLDRICERIAKKLRRFEDEPQKSYPCFISKLAFYYAFQEELVEYEDELFEKDEE